MTSSLSNLSLAEPLARAVADQQYSLIQSGGNMEGKELRFGIADTALFVATTTAATTGSVNAMHD